MMQSEQVARQLHEAHRHGALLLSGMFPVLHRDEVAVATGRALHRLRDPEGTRRCGWKLGYTSGAMRQQMGVSEPNSAPIYEDEIVTERAIVTGRVIRGSSRRSPSPSTRTSSGQTSGRSRPSTDGASCMSDVHRPAAPLRSSTACGRTTSSHGARTRPGKRSVINANRSSERSWTSDISPRSQLSQGS